MKGQEKVLEWNSNLSKLIDSLCFELSVTIPDQNSLSLLEILEWESLGEINREELKELYYGWLESKNIYDLFSAKQLQTYPKNELAAQEGTLKELFNTKTITKILESINSLYNAIYFEKRSSSKEEAAHLLQIEKLFSYLDAKGSINLQFSELFFLNAALKIYDIHGHQPSFSWPEYREGLLQFSTNSINAIDGKVSLRGFKNYFLIKVKNPNYVKEIFNFLKEIQSLTAKLSTDNSTSSTNLNSAKNELPNIFLEGIQVFASSLSGKNVASRVEFLKRIFEENQHLIIFTDSISEQMEKLTEIYGQEIIDCLEIDEVTLKNFKEALISVIEKYLPIFEKLSKEFTSNMNSAQKNNSKSNLSNNHSLLATSLTEARTSPKKTYTSALNRAEPFNGANHTTSFGGGHNHHSRNNTAGHLLFEAGTGNRNKNNNRNNQGSDHTPAKKKRTTPTLYGFKDTNNMTPVKKTRHPQHFVDDTTSDYKRNSRTPPHLKTRTTLHNREFSSVERDRSSKNNTSMYYPRDSTPTKSMSGLTEAPKSYRAAHKKGLSNNNFYERLFFFRNKRVESYEIVMKRLKSNK